MTKPLTTILLTLLAVCAHSASAAPVSLTLSVSDQQKMGVSTTPLASRQEKLGLDAIVRVVDPVPLAELAAGLSSASAARAASVADLRRQEQLAAQDQSASQLAVETARARAAADRSTLDLLHRRLQLEWGPAFAAMPVGELDALVGAVAEAQVAILRADLPGKPEGAVGDITVITERGAPTLIAQPIGLSGSVDPRLRTRGLYGLVRGADAATLRPGRLFPGTVATAAELTGVVIPRAAVVRLDGADWAYVRSGETQFERRRIIDPSFTAAGWFVTQGFALGEAIVERNAGSLIAVERADEATESD